MERINMKTWHWSWLWCFDISSRTRDRSPLFSRRNCSLYLLYCSLKRLRKTRCTILMNLGQEDCPPSTLGAANLMFLAAIPSTEKWVALSSHVQPNYSLKEICKTLRFCGKWFYFFRQPRHCLHLNVSRNCVDVEWNLVSCKLDANRTNIA